MSSRKEVSTRVILSDGSAVTVTMRDGMVIDDIIVQGVKAEAYRIMTGTDSFPTVGRDLRDYLIKIGVILD
jgi:glycine cleavage system aminomethyltransferase T